MVKELGKKIELKYNSPEEKMVKVEIYDAYNDLLFAETIFNGSFSRPYDLSELEEGMYRMIIADIGNRNVEEFEIKENNYSQEFQAAIILLDNKDEDKFAVLAASGKRDILLIESLMSIIADS